MKIHKTQTIFLMTLLGFQIAAMQQPNLRRLLINAAKAGNAEQVEKLMSAGAPVGPETLYHPTVQGNYDVVKTIFESSIDPESPADPNQVFHGLPIFEHLLQSSGTIKPQVKEKLIRLYIKHGADIELRDPTGITLLHRLEDIDSNTIKLLLEQGADANAQTDSGYTALMNLALIPIYSSPAKIELKKMEEQEHKKKAELLIEHGADVNLKNRKGETSLMKAVALRGNSTYDKIFVELLLNNGADPNLKDNRGLTSLMKAVIWRNDSTHDKIFVELLLNNGADPNLKDNRGMTSLMNAVVSKKKIFVELLLKYGADPNLKDNQGLTSLMRAVVSENKSLVELLLKNGANINLKNLQGKSALDYAKDKPEILKLLKDAQKTLSEKFQG